MDSVNNDDDKKLEEKMKEESLVWFSLYITIKFIY